MKMFLFLLFTLVSTLHAQVEVKLMNSAETLKCQLDESVTTYICDDGDSSVLVKNSVFGYMALAEDEKGSPKSVMIESISADNKILFQAAKYSGMGGGMFSTVKTVASEYLSRVSLVEAFFKDKKTGSDAYETIASRFLSAKNDYKKIVEEAAKSKNYSVELETGQNIKCERGTTRTLTKDEADQALAYNLMLQCGAFKCDPVIINGKSYHATMIYDSSPGAFSPTTFHLIDENGIGPSVSIKKIMAPGMDVPLVEESQGTVSKYPGYASMIENSLPSSLGADRSLIAAYKNPLFEQSFRYNEHLCGENNSLKSLGEAKKKLMMKIAELELKEFIQVLADGSLVGNYIDPIHAGEYGCLYNGLILDPNAERNLQHLKKNIFPDKQVNQTITLDRATELFNKAKKMKDIAWKYTPDGCYARAHLMARRFEAEGVRVDKVWIKGDLAVPEAGVRWNFHVAPILYVENAEGQIEKMVIDPSLFDRPVTVEEWDNKMKKGTAKGSTVTAFPFPENAALFERSALAFSSSDPYLPRDSIHLSEEEKMKMSNETMQLYKPMEPAQ